MKILLNIILFNSTLLYAFSINTDKVEHHQFKSLREINLKDDRALVSGIKYNSSTKEYINAGRKFSVPVDVFKRAKELSQSVFKASPGDTGGHGTAFYVGGNFILTNQHVLSPNRRNTNQCKSFSISLHPGKVDLGSRLANFFVKNTLKCKKVHYCSKALDFCLIEMKQHKRGIGLKNYTPLKLVKNNKYDSKMRTMVIGNPLGFGIHASTGIGTKILGHYSSHSSAFHFYAPLFGGNSGGPIIDDNNEVIGIAKMQSKDLESSKAYNVGLPMETVLNVLENELKDKPEVLRQLNY
jgi:V8-like Glu-specific endopeptidase